MRTRERRIREGKRIERLKKGIEIRKWVRMKITLRYKSMDRWIDGSID